MSFLRCPNCGNYGAKIKTTMTNFESCISFLGFFFMVPGFLLLRHYAQRDEQKFIDGENDAGCKICGHRFKIHEAPELPPEILKEVVWQAFQVELERQDTEDQRQNGSGIEKHIEV